jgi:HKD family nuclease
MSKVYVTPAFKKPTSIKCACMNSMNLEKTMLKVCTEYLPKDRESFKLKLQVLPEDTFLYSA